MATTIVGIDPGLVHTGVVVMEFEGPELAVSSFVIEGTDSHAVQACDELGPLRLESEHVFIEAYRPRGNSYGTDPKMRALMAEFKHMLPRATVVDNTGVKQVVSQELLELLGLWRFSTTTHHQDLRSAARIGLYGALKDDALNRVVYDYVTQNEGGS